MKEVERVEYVTPIASVFTCEKSLLDVVQRTLAQRCGECIYESPVLSFDHTDYYLEEMGQDLKRCIYAFEELMEPGDLSDLKNWSNKLEQKLAVNCRRRVNIDVGYISLAKLVLASTKDHSHRLYLMEGIYAEVTLRFVQGSFKPWPWTYPDYASPEYRRIFDEIRNLHRQKIKRVRGHD